MMFRQPFKGDYPVSQRYGETITSDFHTGIDYACPENTPILAAESGTVMTCGEDYTGYGNMVIIQHLNGTATLYAHLNKWIVNTGQKVSKGDVIGYSGNTGNSTGAHLHFEARTQWNKYKTHFDPSPMMQTVIDPKKPKVVKPAFLEPADLPDEVEIICSNGAKLWDENFVWADIATNGTKLIKTGKTIERSGYTFVQVYKPASLKWVAVHDEDTQILGKRTFDA